MIVFIILYMLMCLGVGYMWGDIKGFEEGYEEGWKDAVKFK